MIGCSLFFAFALVTLLLILALGIFGLCFSFFYVFLYFVFGIPAVLLSLPRIFVILPAISGAFLCAVCAVAECFD
jgi:hypothetical protein